MKGIQQLLEQVQEYDLEGAQILDKYSTHELSLIYNGIGSDTMPQALRKAISDLSPDLQAVALIHDVQWHQSDHQWKSFLDSNWRFQVNGYKIAQAKYSWYNPIRYILKHRSKAFRRILNRFGWERMER